MIVFIFDDETTGLVSNRLLALDKQSEVIEFAGALVDLKKKKKLSSYDTLIKPTNYPMDEYTIKETKTRIGNEPLKNAPLFKTVAPKIKNLIETAPLVLAHNLSFDREIIDIEFERLGQTVKWPPGICSVEQSVHLKGFRLSLSNLYEYLFNEKFEGAHRAGVDLDALIRVSCELFKRGLL